MTGNAGLMTTACMAAIRRNAPSPTYIADAERAMNLHDQQRVTTLMGILVAIRQDIEAGYLFAVEQQAREYVYEDFLEMAEGLASSAAGAPAGIVLAVSVLEEHVRKLAEARGIACERGKGDYRSFEDLTAELGQGTDPPLGKSERRVLGGWYSQRTEAAHGHFDKVISANAPGIVTGVRDFIVRHPA
jgi:hypothetical protein